MLKLGMITKQMIERNGFVGYGHNLNSPTALKRVGANPLVIKVEAVTGAQKATAQISAGDALKALAVNAKYGLFKLAKVMFLM